MLFPMRPLAVAVLGVVASFAPAPRAPRALAVRRRGTGGASATALFASPAEVALRLADERLVLSFACFGFFKRECLVNLKSDASLTFAAGMVSAEPGEWRVVGGDVDDGERAADSYLEFSQPLTDTYRELYDVPGGVVFWRGRVIDAGGALEVVDGVAISESTSTARKLLSKIGGPGFQKEGAFTARVVSPDDDPAGLPQPVTIELFDENQDDAKAASERTTRKRKRKPLPETDKGFAQ